MKFYRIIVLLVLSLQISSLAQTMRFQNLTNADGISQSEIYSFLEDSRGFMWIGTLDGLNRYDGYDTTVFNINKYNSNSIPNNTIRALAEDGSGRIWIGTDAGLCVYDPVTEKIFQITINCIGKDASLQIYSIMTDKNYLYIGTSSGLLRANVKTTALSEIGKNFQWIKFSKYYKVDVFDVVYCKNGSVWIATSKALHGMVFQNENKNPLIIETLIDKKFINNIRLDITEDKFGNLWLVSHYNGFCRYNPSTKKLDHYTVNNSNTSVTSEIYSTATADKQGNLWISSRDKGLFFLDAKNLNDSNPQFKNIRNNPYDDASLSTNLIYSLYVTKSNVLWVGTIGSGINIYDPQQKEFHHLKNSLYKTDDQNSSDFIRSLYADYQDNIWMGAHNNGLYILNRKNKTIKKLGFGNQSIFYINKLDNDHVIVCSSKGVSIVKKVNDEIKILSTKFSNAYFYACKTNDDIIWLAGLDGITKCKLVDGNLITIKSYNKNTIPKIALNNCRVLFFNKELNELLVGTEGGGLNILKLNQNQNVIAVKIYKKDNSAHSISNNYVRSIARDSDGNFWIGTFEGLNKLIRNNKAGKITFKNYTKNDGLPNNMIQSIIEDQNKRLWIGTNGGLSKFDLKSEQFVNYSVVDGLQSNEFSEHTVFKKSDGEIIIGGINGINTFYPEKIRSNSILPKTNITGFYIYNKKVDVTENDNDKSPLTKSIVLTDELNLEPDQNSFGFDFSSMLHIAPEKVKYAYILEGFDKDWHYTDAKNRRANYTNLKYGNYIFKVKSSNVDGKWEKYPRTIKINIRTPFVYTWVALILYVLIIASLFVYFANYSVMKYTTKNKMLLDSIHNNKLHELDELRNRFFINISHDLRTPLTLISSPLEIILKMKDLHPDIVYHLNLTQQNVKKLKYITEQLLDFSKAEAGKLVPVRKNQNIVSFFKHEATHFNLAIKNKGIEFFTYASEEVIFTCFDADMISKVFFNILSNAIKHTNHGEINLIIERLSEDLPEKLKQSKYKKFIRIDIQDSGEGIEQQLIEKIFDRFYHGQNEIEKGFGIGLSHCKDLIEATEGIIEVKSELGLGTTFSVYIPDIQIKESGNEVLNSKNMNLDIEEAVAKNENDDTLNNTPTKQKILVVEDNPDMRSFIIYELSKEFKVFDASDGVEGLTMARKCAPDLIVSDIMMPNMDGITFCEKIKLDIKTCHIPVILLTAKIEGKTKYDGINVGADDYIAKPFEMEYLILRIKNILKSREQLQKMFQLNSSLNPSAITVSSLDEKFLKQLMKEMENGISDPEFTVISLESKMGMSHSNFYRKIKNITGQSGKDILLDLRMKRAKQILTDTKGIRISEVAYMVGYTNPKYFSQSFKDFYGVLPSEIENKSTNK